MVPTAILADQHLESFKQILDKYDINIQILKSGMKKKEKAKVLEDIENGSIDILIGTHAILEENLGLVVTDEQHRFGVRQREKIIAKGKAVNTIVMSATPIPRTLGLILYGDLDISIIDELPKGRKEIKTTYTDYNNEEKIYKFTEQELQKGRQVYVVCPLVEQSETMELRSTEEVLENYRERFKDYNVVCIHGKMKEKEKQEIMTKFKDGEINILISERFGLAQLHQLRGRIGRGGYESYCILKLMTKGKIALERAKIMKETSNGFIISEKDLELRGTGDLFGTKQHGIPDFKIANIFEDMKILTYAQIDAMEILEKDPKLIKEENKELKIKVLEMINVVL